MSTIVVGTSSWADPGFVKHWYPKGMAARDRLGFYAQRFEVVELNSSFYATPSRDSAELGELEPIIEGLRPHTLAVEFRYRAWLMQKRIEQVLGFLSERAVTFVAVDAPLADHVTIMPPVDAVTNRRLAYLRCHGRNERGYMSGRTVAERFDYDYSDAELEEITERARTMADDADEVHVLFNNNARELAPKAARRFRQLVGQDPGPEP